MRLPREEIVDLHEVEPRHAPEATRLLDLGRPAVAEDVQTFSAENSAGGSPELLKPVADHRLRRAIHRRGIDHAAARLEEGAMTSAHSSLSSGSSPTLKVIQVPSPTIGKASRLEGMSRRGASLAGHTVKLARAPQRPSQGRPARTSGVSSASDAPTSWRENSCKMRRVSGTLFGRIRGTKHRARHSVAFSGRH